MLDSNPSPLSSHQLGSLQSHSAEQEAALTQQQVATAELQTAVAEQRAAAARLSAEVEGKARQCADLEAVNGKHQSIRAAQYFYCRHALTSPLPRPAVPGATELPVSSGGESGEGGRAGGGGGGVPQGAAGGGGAGGAAQAAAPGDGGEGLRPVNDHRKMASGQLLF